MKPVIVPRISNTKEREKNDDKLHADNSISSLWKTVRQRCIDYLAKASFANNL